MKTSLLSPSSRFPPYLSRFVGQNGGPTSQFWCWAIVLAVVIGGTRRVSAAIQIEEARGLEGFETYCMDCHDASTAEGGFNLEKRLSQTEMDGTLAFENLITRRMPPEDADQPTDTDREEMLKVLAARSKFPVTSISGRKSRFEFNHSMNDLLGIEYSIAHDLPEDRGSHPYDSNKGIQMTRESLSAYFAASEKMIDFALPRAGFFPEMTWVTSRLQNSLAAYNQYTRSYEDGILFSWTRANNGNSYSFFYDTFEPPTPGWYELTFEAAKVGDFEGAASLQVHAGKYYFADDRPQPQRLLDCISLYDEEVRSYKIRGFFEPGESVSVHCFSPKTWRQANPKQGVYIKQLSVTGPVYQWPPRPYERVFADLSLKLPDRIKVRPEIQRSQLLSIGGRVSVSSEQKGMEKHRMLDRSNRTFWHTQFAPTLSPPPHYVVVEHPGEIDVRGLHYSTWTGGNGNGQVKAYEVFLSEDGKTWEGPIITGELVTKVAARQEILFPQPTRKRYIKFLITDSYSIDGRSLASIGQIDVLIDKEYPQSGPVQIEIEGGTEDRLKRVIHDFAQKAFSMPLTEEELRPYFRVALEAFEQEGDFVDAVRVGLKSILTSPRFVWTAHSGRPAHYQIASDLARIFWLSVPDQALLNVAKNSDWTEKTLREQMDRVLLDPKAKRWVRSFCRQWLELRSFQKVSPSLKLYPLYDDLLDHYLPLETEAFVEKLLVGNLPVSNLIHSDFSMLNQRLAHHYGIEGVVGQELREVEWPEDSMRGGLMTMGSILKVTTDGFQTSPILRGAWISKHLVGNTLSPPPESVKAIESEGKHANSLRETIELHQSDAACKACHKSIDPYGFALESFDATGQFRAQYKRMKPHSGTFQYRREGYFSFGQDVDASGELENVAFEDINDLKKLLLKDHKKVSYNVMKQFFEYAMGRAPDLEERRLLYQRIPDERESLGLRDLLKEVLVLTLL